MDSAEIMIASFSGVTFIPLYSLSNSSVRNAVRSAMAWQEGH